jgi:hypothetical protein
MPAVHTISDRTRVASQRQDRHIRIIHLWNFMITAADTASRTPSLANGQIAGQTVCRILRKSGHEHEWLALKWLF